MDSTRTDRPALSEAVRNLMAMSDETVSAKYIAPILRMAESVIIKYAKDGTWDQEHLGKYVISGNRVKFFRKDFLQQCGFVDPEPEEKTNGDRLDELIELLRVQNTMLMELLAYEKTASCCNS